MKILHLEDHPDDAELVRALLKGEWPDCLITVVDTREDYLAELVSGRHDIILSDFKLPGFVSGLEALQMACTHVPEIPFIFLSGTIGEDYAIETVQAGASDYVLKDRMNRLVPVIRHALRECHERRQRRAAEEAVRRSEERYRLLFEGNPQPLWVYDLETLRFLAVNEAAIRHYGYSREEFLAMNIPQICPPEDVPALMKAIAKTGADFNWPGICRHCRKDGRVISVEIVAHSMLFDNRQAGLILANDITEKKRLQEQFLRAQRLEGIGMLAAGIAHDLNNVLTPILMAGPMLRVRATDPQDKRLLETLEHSAERGAALVRQILSFAQGTAGELRLMQVKHLARDIIEIIKETFPKSIKLEQDFPAETWPIQANPTQIHQVLLNLCVNARDAMPRGGTLRLRTGNRRLEVAQTAMIPGARPGAFVVLEVGDTGTGIPPETLSHIWEPFFTTKQEGEGTGLGLSTVRGIVEAHEGFIELQTETGRGTTFRIYLPAADVNDAAGTVTAPPFLPRGNGELLLLVDDEATNRHVAHATLARYGYRVLAAANGTEAVALFIPRADEISLVITDLDMPNLDGASLARFLRQIKPGLRILAVSGLSGKTDKEAGQAENFAGGYLAKPFKAESLLLKVHEVLHSAPRA